MSEKIEISEIDYFLEVLISGEYENIISNNDSVNKDDIRSEYEILVDNNNDNVIRESKNGELHIDEFIKIMKGDNNKIKPIPLVKASQLINLIMDNVILNVKEHELINIFNESNNYNIDQFNDNAYIYNICNDDNNNNNNDRNKNQSNIDELNRILDVIDNNRNKVEPNTNNFIRDDNSHNISRNTLQKSNENIDDNNNNTRLVTLANNQSDSALKNNNSNGVPTNVICNPIVHESDDGRTNKMQAYTFLTASYNMFMSELELLLSDDNNTHVPPVDFNNRSLCNNQQDDNSSTIKKNKDPNVEKNNDCKNTTNDISMTNDNNSVIEKNQSYKSDGVISPMLKENKVSDRVSNSINKMEELVEQYEPKRFPGESKYKENNDNDKIKRAKSLKSEIIKRTNSLLFWRKNSQPRSGSSPNLNTTQKSDNTNIESLNNTKSDLNYKNNQSLLSKGTTTPLTTPIVVNKELNGINNSNNNNMQTRNYSMMENKEQQDKINIESEVIDGNPISLRKSSNRNSTSKVRRVTFNQEIKSTDKTKTTIISSNNKILISKVDSDSKKQNQNVDIQIKNGGQSGSTNKIVMDKLYNNDDTKYEIQEYKEEVKKEDKIDNKEILKTKNHVSDNDDFNNINGKNTNTDIKLEHHSLCECLPTQSVGHLIINNNSNIGSNLTRSIRPVSKEPIVNTLNTNNIQKSNKVNNIITKFETMNKDNGNKIQQQQQQHVYCKNDNTTKQNQYSCISSGDYFGKNQLPSINNSNQTNNKTFLVSDVSIKNNNSLSPRQSKIENNVITPECDQKNKSNNTSCNEKNGNLQKSGKNICQENGQCQTHQNDRCQTHRNDQPKISNQTITPKDCNSNNLLSMGKTLSPRVNILSARGKTTELPTKVTHLGRESSPLAAIANVQETYKKSDNANLLVNIDNEIGSTKTTIPPKFSTDKYTPPCSYKENKNEYMIDLIKNISVICKELNNLKMQNNNQQ